MKAILRLFFLVILFTCISSNARCCNIYTTNDTNQETIMFYYSTYTLHKDDVIRNVRSNVRAYIDSMRWQRHQKEHFIKDYNIVLDAISNSSDPYRFYINDFGSLVDKTGAMNWRDIYYFDRSGTIISESTYNTLSKRKQNQYTCFNSFGEVVSYLNVICKALAKKMEEIKKAQQFLE